MFKQLSIMIATGLISSGAMAADVWHTSTIKTIYPNGNGSWIITLDSDSSSCGNTENPKRYAVATSQNGVTDDGNKKMYAAALMAKAMESTVTIIFSDSTTDCLINRLIVQ